MDGWAFARALRERRGEGPPIPVISAAHDAAAWASQIGAEGVPARPFGLDDLVAGVERLTSRED